METDNTLKPKDLDPALLKRLEDQYGPMDMENDFFDRTLLNYYKTTDVDKETNSSTQKTIKLPSLGDSLKKMSTALKSLKGLLGTDVARNDAEIQKVLDNFKNVFNRYRTHLRKSYPDQYRQIKNQLEENDVDEASTSSGAGSYQTPFAFNKNKNADGTDNDVMIKKYGYKLAPVEEGPGATFGPGPAAGPDGVEDNMLVKKFKYKLVPKPHTSKTIAIVDLSKGKTTPLNEADVNIEEYINGLGIESSAMKKHITSRILGFDKVENKLNELIPLLAQAKIKTMDYYKENPDFKVLYGTDLAVDYLDDLIEMFKD
jgi:hypothetical protein|tara:strand:- start:2025 stop:2969 length:945 start_codon:yes stop_codon:yes gene_type:complete